MRQLAVAVLALVSVAGSGCEGAMPEGGTARTLGLPSGSRPRLQARRPDLSGLTVRVPTVGCGREPSAEVLIATKPGAGAPVEPRYSIYSTTSLSLAALVRNVCGAQRAIFDLYAPDGSFYKRIARDFVAEGDGRGARRVPGGYLVEAVLPVHGTDIAWTPMVGTWSVNFGLGEGGRDAIAVGLFELYL